DHETPVAVDDDVGAVGGDVGEIAEPDDRRNSQGAGENSGVARLAAEIGREGHDVPPVKRCGLRRGEVSGYNDSLVVEGSQAALLFTQEMAQDADGEVVDVVHLGLENIGHRGEACRGIAETN